MNEPHDKPRHSGLQWAAWAAVAVMLYALSLGPVVWLFDRGIISDQAYVTLSHTVYAPMFWLHRNSDLMHDVINWYADLF
ncbi:MAG: hypothetical protein KF861_20240, partial [Planctomycetaceae bacterium]|nr:hypothetical protein [Planctomycetaceae bacterium]